MAVEVGDPELVRRSLRTWMAERLQDRTAARIGDVEVSVPEAPAAGQSNETLAFATTWTEGGAARRGEYILRREPSSHSLLPEPDVLREFHVLQGLQDSGVPAPRVVGAEADPSVQGVPFFVMERVRGTVPFGKPSIHAVGWLTTLDTAQRGTLWRSAMDALAAVHAMPWPRTHGFLARGPFDATVAVHVEKLRGWYEWTTRGRRFPVTDAALRWLRERAPAITSDEPVLVWGDARMGNMVFSDDLAVAAVIDWEFATIGPRELDVGYWLTFDEFLTEASGFDRLQGFPDRAATIAHYERLTGARLHDVDYFEVLAALFLAMTVIRQADLRVERGLLESGTTMGDGNAFTRMLARRLGMPVPEMSPDFLLHRRAGNAN